MTREEIIETDKRYIANTYSRGDVVIESGEGAVLRDADGRRYIDFATGIGVNCFGACDPVWKKAVTDQLDKVQHVCNLFYAEPQARLAKLLCERTGAEKVFFSNSGAEANECAIKTARKYSSDRYGDGRYEIITLNESFHGRTMATLTATGQAGFHKHFDPFLEGFRYADPNMDSIVANTTARTCAVMVEVVQGESGVNLLDGDFLKALDGYCKERDILLVCDEVQCGNGRTGYLYAYEAFGLKPDIVTTAKALGGGLPIGACMMFSKTASTLSYGEHGSTFGGNPVACAGAATVIERLDQKMLDKIKADGEYLKGQIEKIGGVEYVTGMGLMIGVKTKKDPAAVQKECAAKGLLVLTAHDKVRLLPPYVAAKDQMDEAIQILKEAIDE